MTEYFKNYLEKSIENLENESPGASRSLAKLDAEANPDPPITLAWSTTITGWTQDTVEGEGMSVNADGIHIDLTAGDYLVNLLVQFDGNGDETGTKVYAIRNPQGHYGDAGSYFVQSRLDEVGVWEAIGTFWLSLATDGQVHFNALGIGGTTPGAIVYAGIDMIRIS